MSLQVGQKAPEIELFSDEKNLFRLSDHKGKNVLLLFFPAAFTGVCTTELNAVNDTLESYTDADTQVVGLSTDTPFVLAEYKQVHGLAFPLLSDHDAEVSVVYGTKYEPGGFALNLHRITRRAAFVVDKAGTLQYAEILESAGDQPDFDAIKAVLQSL